MASKAMASVSQASKAMASVSQGQYPYPYRYHCPYPMPGTLPHYPAPPPTTRHTTTPLPGTPHHPVPQCGLDENVSFAGMTDKAGCGFDGFVHIRLTGLGMGLTPFSGLFLFALRVA